MTEFSIQTFIEITAQVMTGGNVEVAGILVMLGIFFLAMVVLAVAKAPVQYSIAVFIPLAVVFASMGIINTTLSFIIIIISAVLIGIAVRRMVTEG